MAIAEMTKLRVIGVSYEKERILNALADTRLAEIKGAVDLSGTAKGDVSETSEANEKRRRIDKCIETIEEYVEKNKQSGIVIPKGQADCTLSKLLDAPVSEAELLKLVLAVEDGEKRIAECKSARAKNANLQNQLNTYINISVKFSDIKDTATCSLFLGTVGYEAIRLLPELEKKFPLTAITVESGEENVLFAASHKEEAASFRAALSEIGFTPTVLKFDMTAQEKKDELNKELSSLDIKEAAATSEILECAKKLAELKTLCDYYNFEREKELYDADFRFTESCFVLEAYVPAKSKEIVENALKFTDAICVELLPIEDDEMPPTLMENNKVVRQVEFVTNMYSPPNYRELDPNGVLFFFFMVFFGFIMADIGYGLLLMLGGFLLARRIKKDTGTRRLMYVIGIGGIFTAAFGAAFGTFFGFTKAQIPFLPEAIIPDPVANTMTLLIACLVAGAVQIVVSLVLKAIQLFRRGDVWGGILDALIWVVFFIGLAVFLLDFGGIVTGIKNIGIGIIAFSLLVVILTAGRKEKGIGKATKAFGAVYGIINYASDILSYARLFGLMLSGSIIASIVDELALGVMTTPVGIVFGIIILLIGHAFNLGMGVLGAYIHDARLQYIEFFSRFYEGEGELFAPLGSKLKYIELTK